MVQHSVSVSGYRPRSKGATWRSTGNRPARPKGGDRQSDWIDAVGEGTLAPVDARPDITLAEIARSLKETHGRHPAL